MNNNTKEVWKPIKDYEGYYSVSDFGRVRSECREIKGSKPIQRKRTMRGLVLSLIPDDVGYLRVSLSKDGAAKQFLVHRLVAQAFISNKENEPMVNHKDENKGNNHANNLEWCDNQYNVTYGVGHQSKKKKVKGIHMDTGKEIYFKSTMEAGRNGFQQPNIIKVINGERNHHKRYMWEYVN